MINEIARFTIQSYNGRKEMIFALAEAGYPVNVEEIKNLIGSTFWIVVYDKVTSMEEDKSLKQETAMTQG